MAISTLKKIKQGIGLNGDWVEEKVHYLRWMGFSEVVTYAELALLKSGERDTLVRGNKGCKA